MVVIRIHVVAATAVGLLSFRLLVFFTGIGAIVGVVCVVVRKAVADVVDVEGRLLENQFGLGCV